MNTKDSTKKRANFLYTLLVVVAYSFPIWFIIGVIPWSYMVEFDTELWWKLLWFQIGGLIGVIGSGIAIIKRL